MCFLRRRWRPKQSQKDSEYWTSIHRRPEALLQIYANVSLLLDVLIGNCFLTCSSLTHQMYFQLVPLLPSGSINAALSSLKMYLSSKVRQNTVNELCAFNTLAWSRWHIVKLMIWTQNCKARHKLNAANGAVWQYVSCTSSAVAFVFSSTFDSHENIKFDFVSQLSVAVHSQKKLSFCKY